MQRLPAWPTLTRLLCLSLLTVSVSGCVSVPPTPADPTPAICTGSRAARADLAAALAETQDESVLMAGARLVDIIDAGCAS
jgi:hypothetical protein